MTRFFELGKPNQSGITRLALISFLVVGLVGGSLATYAVVFPQQAQERSGPMSSWPASWMDVCNLPVHGNDTTVDEIPDNYQFYYPGAPSNVSLDLVYSRIVNSDSFKAQTNGYGWVTTYWGMQQDSGPNFSAIYVVAQFVRIFGGQPNGYLSAYYNTETSSVAVNYQSALISSCPALYKNPTD